MPNSTAPAAEIPVGTRLLLQAEDHRRAAAERWRSIKEEGMHVAENMWADGESETEVTASATGAKAVRHNGEPAVKPRRSGCEASVAQL